MIAVDQEASGFLATPEVGQANRATALNDGETGIPGRMTISDYQTKTTIEAGQHRSMLSETITCSLKIH